MHCLIPLFSVCICRLARNQPQYIKLTNSCRIKLRPELCLLLSIWDKDIRDHHTGNIKRFARRRAGHADLRKFFLDRRKHLMLSTKYEVLMNLITHNRNMMFYQNISHRGKLFLRPHTPHRIMRIAKQEQLNIVIYDLTFKILQIYVIRLSSPLYRSLLTTFLPLSAITSENG